jgi:hypothetical protein
MSVPRASLVGSVRVLCGEPPDLPLSQGGLPDNLIFEELVSVEAMMLRDLDLSGKGRRVSLTEVSLQQDQDSFTIPAGDFHDPAYVYLQTDSASDLWHPVEIVGQSGLAEANASGRLAVAVVGTTGYFSWLPDGTHTLRIWYERSGNDAPTMGETTEIGNLYDEYLKLQTAAQCREHLKMEIGPMLQSRLAKSERQWQRYANRGHQRGVGAKSAVFIRHSRFSHLDPHRFFVPR